ncbi:MAG: CoA-binding protein [Rubricoccaceae bacterium]|nr:CoA-binding protein [Rubricoccaceae bacterium]
MTTSFPSYRQFIVEIKQILENATTIAVVGCSPRTSRPSHRIAKYLQKSGFSVIPVNPYHEELLGERCYPDLQSIPDDIELDIVDIFRRAAFTPDVVNDAIERAQATGRHPVIWTQIGVHNEQARKIAEDAGFTYIRNRCLMVEHDKMAAV